MLSAIPADWLWGLAGGLLIGLGGAVYLLANGRIMGASGIIGGLVDRSGWSTWAERVVFLTGVFVLPILLLPLTGPVDTHITDNWIVIIAAGLLVGIGTRLANGCTSGHGVCGISRLSLRGMVATVFYIMAGGLTVILFRHILGVI
ncbi:putative transporter component [Thalassovita autumnalis]|uniref:Transporter component n=1 Tax=Thalassovita autumnalis TaxID=2072972 RepID=A0A0P1G8X7_9RHOB|nr:putative transporter component [Thalassovita autumnalis]CUH73097.1 putative transporter component [Thalassovita autumnalis]